MSHAPCLHQAENSKMGGVDRARAGTGSVTSARLKPPKRSFRGIILHTPAPTKVLVLLAIVVLGSACQACGMVPPETIFSRRGNPINKYLVKFSWLWTLIFLVPVVSISSILYSGLLTYRAVLRHMGRIAVGHMTWYCTTWLIDMVDNSSGACSMGDIKTAKSCVTSGHKWEGFDISGHTFMLSYSVLLITEEAYNISKAVWEGYEEALSREQRVLEKRGTLKDWLRTLHYTFGYLVEPLQWYALALVLIWTFMLLMTALHYHTYIEKLIGSLIAVGAWYISYRSLYGKEPYLPCRPNEGSLHPLLTK